MKINFRHDNFKAIYRVGNVIKDRAGFIYLIVKKEWQGYTLVNLTNNEIYASYDTMQALIRDFARQGQALVNTELTIL